MRTRIIHIMFAVMVVMTGIVAAEPCPDSNGVLSASKTTDKISPYSTTLGTERSYFLTTSFDSGYTHDTKEFCVYNIDAQNTIIGVLDLLQVPYDITANWEYNIKPNDNSLTGRDRVEFKSYKGNYPISSPVDDKPIGKINYETLPANELIVLHIRDNGICRNSGNLDGDNDPETCFVRESTTTNVPEFPTMALPIAAVLGLVFFIQQRKTKEE